MDNLTIIGTSHISKQSVKEVRDAIRTHKPQIVALELDKDRLQNLLSGQENSVRFRDIGKIGIKGYLFALLASWAEKKLGSLVGVKPGTEMVTAARLAKKEKIELALVDQHISITLRRLTKGIGWKDKWNFLVDLFTSRKKKMPFDLSKVPEKDIIKALMKEVRYRYPGIYRVLIEERNEVIAGNLRRIMQMNPDSRIVAVLGAGHVEEVRRMLEEPEDITYSFHLDI